MEHKSRYLQDGQPKLRESYCVYMDILGFTQMIRSNQEALFNQFYDVISRQVQSLKSLPDNAEQQSPWEIKVLTDNIVMGYPYFADIEPDTALTDIIYAVADYQLTMVLEGFFVRGGLSTGLLFMDENLVYGQALLDAYDLETNTARDPRIVLSKDVCDLVRSYADKDSPPHHSPYNRNVLIDPDGWGYINYLERLIYEDGAQERVDWEGVEKHKVQIEIKLRNFASKPDIWSKYYWLANYHNYFCEKYENYEGYNETYLVGAEFAKRHPTPLVDASTIEHEKQ